MLHLSRKYQSQLPGFSRAALVQPGHAARPAAALPPPAAAAANGQATQTVHSFLPALTTTQRRSLLAATAACLVSSSMLLPHPVAAAGGRKSLQQDPRLAPLQMYWRQLVTLLHPQLSDAFAPSLVFYGPGELLPSGAPGDPALEYSRRRAASCGPFTPGFAQPYSCCPQTPAGIPDSDEARQCCRHFAYCVPRSRYAFAAIDRQSSVVASPRLALAPPETWQGVLLHEMGHCIDFWTFPERYRLPAEVPPRSAAAASVLAVIDQEEPDAELRADLMSNALLAPLLGAKMCYDSRTHIQALVPPSTDCIADELAAAAMGNAGGSSGLLGPPTYTQHFPHLPVSA